METVNGRQYYTKEEALALCKAYAAAHPGTKVFNHAAHKGVRRTTTEAEREAERKAWGGNSYRLEKDVFTADRLYYDGEIIAAHPELKGLWRITEVEA